MTGSSIDLPMIRPYLIAFDMEMREQFGNKEPHGKDMDQHKLVTMICAARDHAEAIVRHEGSGRPEADDDFDFPYPDGNGEVWYGKHWNDAR